LNCCFVSTATHKCSDGTWAPQICSLTRERPTQSFQMSHFRRTNIHHSPLAWLSGTVISPTQQIFRQKNSLVLTRGKGRAAVMSTHFMLLIFHKGDTRGMDTTCKVDYFFRFGSTRMALRFCHKFKDPSSKSQAAHKSSSGSPNTTPARGARLHICSGTAAKGIMGRAAQKRWPSIARATCPCKLEASYEQDPMESR